MSNKFSIQIIEIPMSNDKQSMKLYTEEQLLNTADAIRNYLKNYHEKFHESMIEKHLKSLGGIELPTDEEIDEKAFEVPYDNTKDFYDLQFIKGAKFVIDKIQGGNNDKR
jgi:hypothetical protein